MSVLAAVHAGAETEEGKAVVGVVRGWGTGDRATLIPSGARGTLHQATYAGAALDRIRHLETLTPDEVRELVHLVCR
ncbi:MAG: hypothetical protein A2Y95_04885 [Deltaproteobacteria bacterium RBG_13_65_10]|nr:MAG: hypothetical protein A2Y95_04885 [Deltaproteobacteria bacterium RBG_13_65_10]